MLPESSQVTLVEAFHSDFPAFPVLPLGVRGAHAGRLCGSQ